MLLLLLLLVASICLTARLALCTQALTNDRFNAVRQQQQAKQITNKNGALCYRSAALSGFRVYVWLARGRQ